MKGNKGTIFLNEQQQEHQFLNEGQEGHFLTQRAQGEECPWKPSGGGGGNSDEEAIFQQKKHFDNFDI